MSEKCSCCVPNLGQDGFDQVVLPSQQVINRSGLAEDAQTGMALIPSGIFRMGSEDPMSYPADGEGPVRSVSVSEFLLDTRSVTNADFMLFIDETGYITTAEQRDWSFVFAGLLPDDFEPTRGVADAPWWRQVYKATWQHPEGLHSNINDRMDHPVVHVSWFDAAAYADWLGKELPSEACWEYAARGGLDGALFPWGEQLNPDDNYLSNTWQGIFPSSNTQDDGWYGTCPADHFPENGYGLHNMTGNVWEWCADWFGFSDSRVSSPVDPIGPATGNSKVQKGGSFLCHASYCARYRPAARVGVSPDSTSSNVGFRCLKRV